MIVRCHGSKAMSSANQVAVFATLFLFSTTKSNPRQPRFLGTTWMTSSKPHSSVTPAIECQHATTTTVHVAGRPRYEYDMWKGLLSKTYMGSYSLASVSYLGLQQMWLKSVSHMIPFHEGSNFMPGFHGTESSSCEIQKSKPVWAKAATLFTEHSFAAVYEGEGAGTNVFLSVWPLSNRIAEHREESGRGM
ncbi:hypothetical protein B0H11DRAFT_1937497 [Mycena galericulata]|nr:hypothetical protein B0H11DRAFT_1937497 [Mycena galericulata]